MEDHPDAGDGLYAAVCVNEKGVAITGTVSASGSDAWKEADPYVDEFYEVLGHHEILRVLGVDGTDHKVVAKYRHLIIGQLHGRVLLAAIDLQNPELTRKGEDGKVLAAQSVCDGKRGDGSNLRIRMTLPSAEP